MAKQQLPTTGTTEAYGTATPAPRGRRVRRLAFPVAAAAALVATAGAVTVAQAASSGTTATPTCATSGLSASLGKSLGGGMMHEGTVLKLKNTTGHTCLLRGYPGLGLEDSSHHALTSKTTWGGTYYAQDPGKKTLTLKAGQSAEAVIAWTHANTGTSDATHARYLVVTPPASKTHKSVKLDSWVDSGRMNVTSMAYSVKVTS